MIFNLHDQLICHISLYKKLGIKAYQIQLTSNLDPTEGKAKHLVGVVAHSSFRGNRALAVSQFVRLEALLFSYRLKEMPKRDIEVSLKHVLRHLRSLGHHLSFLLSAVSSILDEDMLENSEASFTVPFSFVPALIAKRKVILKDGKAVIQSEDVPSFLESVFADLLRKSICDMTQLPIEYGAKEDEDQRVSILIQRISKQIQPSTMALSKNKILAKDVDHLSQFFPLCFQHVHKRLTENHRLGHNARIAYTLFLKEIGLSQEESVTFWSHHYSKQKSLTSKQICCSHSWQEDAKKYEYSIRHLFGQNGSRTNYSAHGCESISNRSASINEELVCPFTSYDIEDLGKVVGKDILISDLTQDYRKICVQMLPSEKRGFNLAKPSQYFTAQISNT